MNELWGFVFIRVVEMLVEGQLKAIYDLQGCKTRICFGSIFIENLFINTAIVCLELFMDCCDLIDRGICMGMYE